ncbi:TPR repeat protein [Nitrospina gracilis]|uniref:tetratricopeptide repeat protein n=1 Tax=Nitrospina TaxID=35800 RepID=UPI000345787D|nr:tetratricopeptide repeat protein [Nitrospina gracilis]MCF8723204.1 TPR repeat protein [Nitrospina sp. Nb-3]
MHCIQKKCFSIMGLLVVSLMLAGATEGRYQEGIQFLNFNDYPKAHDILKPLAEEGHMRAQTQIAHLYRNGLGVEQDHTLARHWYLKAAQQGSAEARFHLGKMYFEGDGVPKDFRRAFKWFELAARKGNATAQYRLGAMYELSQGVIQNYAKAAYWYQQAANQGMPQAQFMLADLYYKGQGVPQDLVLAHMWVNLAVKTSRPADKDYNDMVLLRDKLERLMSANQIRTAQNKMDAWQSVN